MVDLKEKRTLVSLDVAGVSRELKKANALVPMPLNMGSISEIFMFIRTGIHANFLG